MREREGRITAGKYRAKAFRPNAKNVKTSIKNGIVDL